ncbi:MAG: hypothetical protein WBL61_09735 [Bryobacteraceae bacterium]
MIRTFWREDRGQDLIEYTLLLGFLALASAAFFIGAGGKVNAIWKISNTQLSTAATCAS